MKKKMKGVLFATLLAVAGLFGISSALVDKQVNETPIVEKADAATWQKGDTFYIRIFKSWLDTASATAYMRFNSSAGWKNYTIGTAATANMNIVGGDSTFYYFKKTFANAPTSTIYIKRYNTTPPDNQDDSWNQGEVSNSYSKNLISVSDWNTASYASANICNYHFQSPSNGSVTAVATNHGTITQGNADNYIYSDWTVTLTPSANSGYGFSHWTESTNSGSSYVAFSGSDIRNNPLSLTNMSGDVYHGVLFKQYKSIYYISGETTETTNRIYAWTNYATASGTTNVLEFGSYAECWAVRTAGSEVFSDGIVHFNGSQNKIYKINLFSDNFLLTNNNQSMQTSNFDVTSGSGYFWDSKSVDAGAAIALIVDEENARNNVPASGSIKQYSICGIDATTINSLVSRYNGLTSGAQTYVNSSTTYTYKGDGTSDQDNISFSSIFLQLSKMSGAKGSSAIRSFTPFSLIDGESSNNATTIIIIIASSVSLLSITALSVLLVKKRKNKEQ